MNSQKKATTEVFLFVAFGIVGIIVALQHLMLVWPLTIIYGMMAWKRHASLSFTSKVISPHTIIQRTLHIILFFLHLSLAFSFANPGFFSILMLVFLLLETLTYTLKPPSVPESAPLFRKIKINMVEALFALLALVGIFFEYTQFTLVIWSILLTDISIYSILIRKMYATPNPT